MSGQSAAQIGHWVPPSIEVNSLRDLHHVDIADRVGEISDLVDRRYLRGEQSVVRILDELGRARVDADLVAVPNRIELLERGQSRFVLVSQDNAIRLHEICDGGAFAQEFGIHAKAEAAEGFAGSCLELSANHRVGGPRDYRAFHHDRQEAVRLTKAPADLVRDRAHSAKIDRAINRRCADGDDGHFGIRDSTQEIH